MAFENIHTEYRSEAKVPGAGELAEIIREGMTVDEVADLFDASPATVRAALSHGGYRSNGQPMHAATPPAEVPNIRNLFRPQPWADRALCAQTDPELFYPEKGGDATASRARSVCQSCPVAAECLDYALDNNEHFGIWGGLSTVERRALKTSA